jgi:hypothetical protein
LEIPGEVWKEGAGDLGANAVPGKKDIARQQTIQVQASDFFGLEILRLQRLIAVAGAKNIESRTHEIESSAVGSHIQQTDPEIHITTSRRKINFCADGAGNFRVCWKWIRVKDKDVLAPG